MSVPFTLLSTFPGIDALGHAFALEWPDASIVRGPDPIFGGDIRNWHAQAGIYHGVFGGPPCQPSSRLVHIVKANGYEPRHGNLIPDFERVVSEAQPAWFIMENVADAPLPVVHGYEVQTILVNNRQFPVEIGDVYGAEQNRERRFSFGTRDARGLILDVAAFDNPIWQRAVVNSSKEGGLAKSRVELATGRMRSRLPSQYARRTVAEGLRLQGLPEDYLDESPLTVAGKYRAIGNCVPVPTGRAIARAVRRALGLPIVSEEANHAV